MPVIQTVQGRIQAGGRGWGLDWVASQPLFAEPKLKKKKIEKACEYYGRNKGKDSGQVAHCNF